MQFASAADDDADEPLAATIKAPSNRASAAAIMNSSLGLDEEQNLQLSDEEPEDDIAVQSMSDMDAAYQPTPKADTTRPTSIPSHDEKHTSHDKHSLSIDTSDWDGDEKKIPTSTATSTSTATFIPTATVTATAPVTSTVIPVSSQPTSTSTSAVASARDNKTEKSIEKPASTSTFTSTSSTHSSHDKPPSTAIEMDIVPRAVEKSKAVEVDMIPRTVEKTSAVEMDMVPKPVKTPSKPTSVAATPATTAPSTARTEQATAAPASAPAPSTAAASRPVSSTTSHHRSTSVASASIIIDPLTPQEVAELRTKFQSYDYDHNDLMDRSEIIHCLSDLEYTYNDEYVTFLMDAVFGMPISTTTQQYANANSSHAYDADHRLKGKLQFAEFLQFMQIFYQLHDAVVHVIETDFLRLFGREPSDDHLAILCSYVSFNDRHELDFTVMNEKLKEALAAEVEEVEESPQPATRVRQSHPPTDTSSQQQQQPQQQQQQQPKERPMTKEERIAYALEHAREAKAEREEAKRRVEQEKTREAREAVATASSPSLSRNVRQDSLTAPSSSFAPQQEIRSASPQPMRSSTPQHLQAPTTPQSRTQRSPSRESVNQARGRWDEEEEIHEKQLFGADASHQHDSTPALTIPPNLLSADADDESYLSACWSTFLHHFAPSEPHLGISMDDVGRAFRAMGLDPTSDRLREMFARVDRDGSGRMDYHEFKAYYTELYREYLKKGLDLGQLKSVFRQFDEDGDGDVTISEFQHVMSTICSNATPPITSSDIDTLISLIDTNHDHHISFREFLDFIRASVDERQQYGTIQQRMSYVLIRKMIRAQMPSPMEHILAFANMPSNFRPSMLASYQHRDEFRTSSVIAPVLDHTGLVYNQFAIDPEKRCLRTIPHPNPDGSIRPSTGYQITLEGCSGIPLPSVDHRNDIVARRVRMCMFEAHRPVSNLYLTRADWCGPSQEDCWTFPNSKAGLRDHDGHRIVIKTCSEEVYLLFELTVLVKKPGTNPNPPLDGPPPQESDFIEMSCGFATLDLGLSEPLDRSGRITRPVMGGTIHSRQMIRESEILSHRSGWRAFTQLFQSKIVPTLHLTIVPEPKFTMSRRMRYYYQYLPCHLITPVSSLRILKQFYEMLVDRLLLPAQPLAVGKIHDMGIITFLRMSDQCDLMQMTTELWEEVRQRISKKDRRDKPSGAPSDIVKHFFREVMGRVWSVLSLSKEVMPPLIVGVTDNRRIPLIRLQLHADTFRSFTTDAMPKGAPQYTGLSTRTRSMSEERRGYTVDDGEMVSNLTSAAVMAPSVDVLSEHAIYIPFHTNQVSYDHSVASEDHHAERRANNELRLLVAQHEAT